MVLIGFFVLCIVQVVAIILLAVLYLVGACGLVGLVSDSLKRFGVRFPLIFWFKYHYATQVPTDLGSNP